MSEATMNNDKIAEEKAKAFHDLRKSLRRMKLIVDALEANNVNGSLISNSELDKLKSDLSNETLNIQRVWDNSIKVF